jgi:acetyltransferase-like isoleucine patch superfamily enzyme
MFKRIIQKIKKIVYDPNKYARSIGVILGEGSRLNKTVSFGSEPYLVKIGDLFYCSTNVSFITHDGSVNVLRNIDSDFLSMGLFNKIKVGDNVFLGYSVTVLPGSQIGDNVIVGSNSLVKGVLASNSVYAGIPAKYICDIETYFDKIKPNLIDTSKFMGDKKTYLLDNL